MLPVQVKAYMAINSTSRKHILLNISINEINLEFKHFQGTQKMLINTYPHRDI